MIEYRWILFGIRNFQTKVVEEIKTLILCSMTLFSEDRAVYETMWKNTAQ
jgi:hypothetical protein